MECSPAPKNTLEEAAPSSERPLDGAQRAAEIYLEMPRGLTSKDAVLQGPEVSKFVGHV